MARRKLKHSANDIFLEDIDLEIDDDREEGYDGYDKEPESSFDDSIEGRKSYGRKSRSTRRKKQKRRKWPFIAAAIVLVVVGVLLFNHFRKGKDWTIAVFGVDARDSSLESGTRSDVIMLINIDRETGEVKLCSVYRDTYLKINEDGDYGKINLAYQQGGHEQAIAMLEENLDIEIDDYGTFGWGTVAEVINALGGIDLEITDSEFYYINAFITETVEVTGIGSQHLTSAGWNHLDGVQAVAYGRLRLMDTDFQRTARQRKVLELLLEKAKEADVATLAQVATQVLSEISTSIGIDDVIPILGALSDIYIGEDGSSGFPFSRTTMNIGSQNYVVATTLESNVEELHLFLYGDEDYTVPQSVQEISSHISSVTGLTEAGENAAVPSVGGSSQSSTTAVTEEATEAVTETEAETEIEEEETETKETAGERPSEDESPADEPPADVPDDLPSGEPGDEPQDMPSDRPQEVPDNGGGPGGEDPGGSEGPGEGGAAGPGEAGMSEETEAATAQYGPGSEEIEAELLGPGLGM